jgi:hypothetical protein
MRHFDDIPISQIRKMPGYQTGANMQDQEANGRPSLTDNTGGLVVAPTEQNDDLEGLNVSLSERVIHQNWRIRLEAFKQINKLFYSDYAAYEASQGLGAKQSLHA